MSLMGGIHPTSRIASSTTRSTVYSIRRYATRNIITNDKNSNVTKTNPIRPVYVNRLSQLVLEHLQNSKKDWLVRRGLDRGLRIHEDGTFVLRFPLNQQGREGGRIWTSIDPSSKQHHLSVFRGTLIAQYGLKDPLTISEKKNSASSEDSKIRVQSVVNQMIQTLDQIDGQLDLEP